MWFLVAISISAATAYSGGNTTRYTQIGQVSQHKSKVECQIAADGVRWQIRDFSEANNSDNRVRLICVQGGQQ